MLPMVGSVMAGSEQGKPRIKIAVDTSQHPFGVPPGPLVGSSVVYLPAINSHFFSWNEAYCLQSSGNFFLLIRKYSVIPHLLLRHVEADVFI